MAWENCILSLNILALTAKDGRGRMHDRRKGVRGQTQALRCAPPSLSIDKHSSIFRYETLFLVTFTNSAEELTLSIFRAHVV